MDGFIIPSSIQRVRSFLVEMYGMKVKPWASTEETLAALHTMLVERQHCDRFWASLRGLLERLAGDVKKRQEALPGALVDNELLDGQRYATLLDEIRACLSRQASDATTGSFRRLAGGLSAPALGLLLLLGGAATVGCDHTGLKGGSQAPDAAVQADTKAGQPDVAAHWEDANDGQPVAKTDAPVVVLPPPPDVSPDQRVAADVPPPHDAVAVGPDGAVVTIQDIMDSCNITEDLQSEIRRCLSFLRTSWTTGLAQELAGQGCGKVESRLDGFWCWLEACQPPRGGSQEFVAGAVPYCPPTIVYIGVRFV